MTLEQRRNRLTTHFSERIPVINRYISVDIRPHVEVMSVRLWHTDSTYILRQTDSLTIPHAQLSQNVLGTFRLSAMLTHNTVYWIRHRRVHCIYNKNRVSNFGEIWYKRSQPATDPVLFLATKTQFQNLLWIRPYIPWTIYGIRYKKLSLKSSGNSVFLPQPALPSILYVRSQADFAPPPPVCYKLSWKWWWHSVWG